MTSREKFEAWYLENWGHTEDNEDSMFEVNSHDSYHRLGVRMAYDAWQASRAAIEIRVPVKDFNNPSLSDGNGLSFSEAMDVFDAIRAAGISVKGE